MLRRAQLIRAEPSSVDCGDARAGEPAQSLQDCMVSAFERRQPFHARFWKQGIDSTLAAGLALDPGGKLFLYRFDSSPCGAPGRCRPELKETPCMRAYVRQDAAGKQLVCADPPFSIPPIRVVDQNPMPVGGDVKPPRVIHRVEPQYEACKGITVSAVPLLEAVIDEEGTVRDVRLLKPIHPCLDRNLTEALRQWRFEPGTLHGRPVSVVVTMTVYIHFK